MFLRCCWKALQFWHLSISTSKWHLCESARLRVAYKTSKTCKTTCALWLASNLTSMPLAIKRRINNQKSRASPTQTCIAVDTLVATYNFAASPFRTAHTVSRTSLDHACFRKFASVGSLEGCTKSSANRWKPRLE